MASNATAYCCWFCCSLQFGRLKCNASNCKSLAGRVRVWPGLAWPGLAWLQTINLARCGGNYVTILAIHNYRIQLQLHNSQANARRVSFLSLSVSFSISFSISLSLSLLLAVIICSLVLHNPACHSLSKCILIKRALCKSIASKHVLIIRKRGRWIGREDISKASYC